jgi:hypothetical protein
MTATRNRLGCDAFLLFLLAGCSGASSVVTGTVTLDGKPIEGGPQMYGTVTFYHPDGSGAPAVGIIDASGRYLLKTGTQGQLPPGEYRVAIAVKRITPPATPGGLPQPHLVTPAEYQSVQTSGLRASVQPGNNTLDFSLASSGPAGDQ